MTSNGNSTGTWTITGTGQAEDPSGEYFIYNAKRDNPVPEPPVGLLVLAGAVPLAVARWRRRSGRL